MILGIIPQNGTMKEYFNPNCSHRISVREMISRAIRYYNPDEVLFLASNPYGLDIASVINQLGYSYSAIKPDISGWLEHTQEEVLVLLSRANEVFENVEAPINFIAKKSDKLVLLGFFGGIEKIKKSLEVKEYEEINLTNDMREGNVDAIAEVLYGMLDSSSPSEPDDIRSSFSSMPSEDKEVWEKHAKTFIQFLNRKGFYLIPNSSIQELQILFAEIDRQRNLE